MADWTSGYVTEIGYTYGYYPELNPARAQLACLYAGLVPPQSGVHCELGFGQGISVNIHAAASGANWYGNDFIPAQAAFAQSLAHASGAAAELSDESFYTFCHRANLPDFDFIGLHGVWSWISDENRALIVDFVSRKLKAGGVLYMGYNTQPGWAAAMPLRELLSGHVVAHGEGRPGIAKHIDAALAFAERLISTNPIYVRNNPKVPEHWKLIKDQNRNYLAHEYFNRDWVPMSFARVARWLAPAGLYYAGSAKYLDHVATLNLTAEQQALIADISDPVFRETVREFCTDPSFRQDYWVKGAQKLNAAEQATALRRQRVILAKARSDVPLTTNCTAGTAALDAAIYMPILDVLADQQPRTLGEIEQVVAGRVDFGRLREAVLVLIGAGAVLPAQNEPLISEARVRTARLNAKLMSEARADLEIDWLASPVSGGGVAVSRIEQLFLWARSEGASTPEDWVRHASRYMSARGVRLMQDGKKLETAEQNLALLSQQAESFAEKRLPVLRALQVA